ncbi:ribose 5-phosphate isomerase A [Bacillus sp. S13(2024)]|uniref:ribose 5-phosphate isomerase A n=1 Tax=unclassified Bacillus (in: firmicutes) TaxID=185979 RepID=UPI003D1DE089
MDTKRLAGEYAVDFIKDGMTIGLGTGSTVYWTIQKLGELVREGLSIRGVPTSKQTEQLAKELQIPLVSLSEVDELDLTIDGADEISDDLQLTKGGGALLREKLVATASKQLIIVADESKLVSHLGQFPLPVEVVPFAAEHTAQRIFTLVGCTTTLRLQNNKPYITDNGNFIVDCAFPEFIANPIETHQFLKTLTGVVETGLFINMAHIVIIGKSNGVKKLISQNK